MFSYRTYTGGRDSIFPSPEFSRPPWPCCRLVLQRSELFGSFRELVGILVLVRTTAIRFDGRMERHTPTLSASCFGFDRMQNPQLALTLTDAFGYVMQRCMCREVLGALGHGKPSGVLRKRRVRKALVRPFAMSSLSLRKVLPVLSLPRSLNCFCNCCVRTSRLDTFHHVPWGGTTDRKCRRAYNSVSLLDALAASTKYT